MGLCEYGLYLFPSFYVDHIWLKVIVNLKTNESDSSSFLGSFVFD